MPGSLESLVFCNLPQRDFEAALRWLTDWGARLQASVSQKQTHLMVENKST